MGFGLGCALAAAACWGLPYLLGTEAGWVIAGQVAAWVFFTVAATGSLIEVEKRSGRQGFTALGVAALFVSVGAGLLALATRVIQGAPAAIAGVLGMAFIVCGCVFAGLGIGGIASGHPKRVSGDRAAPADPPGPPQRPGFSPAEVVAIALAAAQVILGALALLLRA